MNGLEIDHQVAFGSAGHWVLLALVVFGRGMDLFSTWVATPTLELEANPIARALGWRWGIAVNLGASVGLSLLPVAAISVATTSLLVAARNLQSAWLIRDLGEHAYRSWIAAQYRETPKPAFLLLLLLHAGLIALVGVGLMLASGQQLIPFSVGFGIVVYALAVALFTALGMRRAARREARERAEWVSTVAPERT